MKNIWEKLKELYDQNPTLFGILLFIDLDNTLFYYSIYYFIMLLRIYPENPNPKEIKKVVDCLKNGGVIIYPTDTVYGIGCDVNNKKAMERICRIKGLDIKNITFPLCVMI